MFCADREIGSKSVYTAVDSLAYQFKNAVRVLLICQCQSDVRKLIPNVVSVHRHTSICLFVDTLTLTHRYLGKTKFVINYQHHLKIFFFIPLDVFMCVWWSGWKICVKKLSPFNISIAISKIINFS